MNFQLLNACLKGNLDIVKTLINQKNINQDLNGATPLNISAYNGYLNVVEFLYNAGADINKATINGYTPLIAASQNGYLNVVEFLYNAGANINKAMTDGSTPLFVASCNGNLNIVEFLYNAGANINKGTTDGVTPLHISAYNGHLNVVEFLYKAGADINKATTDGATPLSVAAMDGCFDVVKYLLEHGAKTPNDQDLFDYIQTLDEPIKSSLSEIQEQILEKRKIALKYIGNDFVREVISHEKHIEFDKAATKFMQGNNINVEQFNETYNAIPDFKDKAMGFLMGTHKRLGEESRISMLCPDILQKIMEEHLVPVEVFKMLVGIDSLGTQTDLVA